MTELAALCRGLRDGTLEPETAMSDLRRLADDPPAARPEWWRLGRPDPRAEFRDLEISYALHLDPDCEVQLNVATWRTDVRELAGEVLAALAVLSRDQPRGDRSPRAVAQSAANRPSRSGPWR